MKNLKKIIVGASMIAQVAITNVDASENHISQEDRARIDREADGFLKELENDLQKLKTANNKEKLAELETQFKNSPYLYQKYKGNVDKYIKDAQKLTPEEAKKAAKVIAEIDKKYFDELCENSYGLAHNSQIVFDTKIKNGERRLSYNKDSYLFCGEANSSVVDVFRLNREYCEANKADCNEVYQFGQDTVCRCESDNDSDEFGPVKDEQPVSSLNKAKNKNIAVVQSMLYVKGR